MSSDRLNRILEFGSIGPLAAAVARIVGWSPAGRVIELASVEGPASTVMIGRTLSVRAVMGGSLIVERTDRGPTGNAIAKKYLLRPRHSGWTTGSLMATSIAVTIHTLTSNEPADAIGTAVARLALQPVASSGAEG